MKQFPPEVIAGMTPAQMNMYASGEEESCIRTFATADEYYAWKRGVSDAK